MPSAELVPTLVSPRRLGAALHAHRIALGASLTALSRRCDGWWTPDELLEVERGAAVLDDASIVSLCRLYALPGRGLAVARDLDLVHDRSGSVDLIRTDVDRAAEAARVSVESTVLRYAALLEIVGVSPRDDRPWRSVLAEGLCVAVADVDDVLTAVRSDRVGLDGLHSSLADRIAVPAVGLVVAESTNGSLVLVRRAGGAVRTAHEPVPAAGPLRWFDTTLALSA